MSAVRFNPTYKITAAEEAADKPAAEDPDRTTEEFAHVWDTSHVHTIHITIHIIEDIRNVRQCCKT
jgi:hypothetical protein